MSAPILELKELDVFYGPIQALKKVSMHINEGETVSLIGANGAGKSTLLMSIFGSRARLPGTSFTGGQTSPASRRTTSLPTVLRSHLRGGGCSPT